MGTNTDPRYLCLRCGDGHVSSRWCDVNSELMSRVCMRSERIEALKLSKPHILEIDIPRENTWFINPPNWIAV